VRARQSGWVDIERHTEAQAVTSLNAFMWILIGSLLLAIIIGYPVWKRI
jgi:hypothetical protein